MAIEKKDIMGVAPWIFDFFGGPGNKLKKKAIVPHCTLSPRILTSPGSLDEGDFLLSRELPCLKEPCLTQGNNLHRF